MKGKLEKIDKSKLPVYEIVVDDNDDTGIQLISLVDEPAIAMKGMMFNVEQSVMSFKEVGDKQIIVGPALIPNMKIYREDEKFGQYYVVFTKETIEKMVEKFNKYGSNRKINIDHSNQMVNAFIMEDWIVENEVYDKSRMYGFEVPVGTYMIMVKIEDTDFWLEEVKGNEKFGFSIEGLLGQQLVSLSKQEEVLTIDDLDLDDLLNIFELGEYEKGVPHYTADGKLYTGPTHKDASGRLMTGATHGEDSEYLYHKEDLEIECSNCDWSWNLTDGGSDPYICHKCGTDNKSKEFAVIGPRGGVKSSPKAPKSGTANKDPKGEGSAKGDASSSRGAKVSERVEKILKEKSDDFNERYKEKLGYGVDVGMLKSVYQRGVGAFNISHSPNVSSPEQWALARVNAFLYMVKNGRPENKKYVDDNDLLPKEHPKKSFSKIELKTWRNTANSSNVDKMKWNDETKELVIKFNDGSYYTYFDIDSNTFFSIVNGEASCITEGENENGSWWVGKTPSVGASVYEYLVSNGVRYESGGSLK